MCLKNRATTVSTTSSRKHKISARQSHRHPIKLLLEMLVLVQEEELAEVMDRHMLIAERVVKLKARIAELLCRKDLDQKIMISCSRIPSQVSQGTKII